MADAAEPSPALLLARHQVAGVHRRQPVDPGVDGPVLDGLLGRQVERALELQVHVHRLIAKRQQQDVAPDLGGEAPEEEVRPAGDAARGGQDDLVGGLDEHAPEGPALPVVGRRRVEARPDEDGRVVGLCGEDDGDAGDGEQHAHDELRDRLGEPVLPAEGPGLAPALTVLCQLAADGYHGGGSAVLCMSTSRGDR